MPTTPKEILASVSRLHGASPGEIAADLGVTRAEVQPFVRQLVDDGLLSPIMQSASIVPNGQRQIDPSTSDRTPLGLTFRGFMELAP